MVNRTFSTSMEVGVHVESEHVQTGVRVHCCSANLVFVTLPRAEGQARPVLRRVVPSSPEHERVFAEAGARRDVRQRRKSLQRVSTNGTVQPVVEVTLRPVTHRDQGEGTPHLPAAPISIQLTQSLITHLQVQRLLNAVSSYLLSKL